MAPVLLTLDEMQMQMQTMQTKLERRRVAAYLLSSFVCIVCIVCICICICICICCICCICGASCCCCCGAIDALTTWPRLSANAGLVVCGGWRAGKAWVAAAAATAACSGGGAIATRGGGATTTRSRATEGHECAACPAAP